jgi:hypothetical protein
VSTYKHWKNAKKERRKKGSHATFASRHQTMKRAQLKVR